MERNTYTENDYINKCNDLKMIYIGNHKEKKRGTMIDFVCHIHEDKGIQTSDWSHFRTYAKGCKYCAGRCKTNEDIEKEIFNKDVELISEYKGNEKPIRCRCKVCSNEWTTLPKTLITNKAGCPICGKKKAILGETKTQEDFEKELFNVNPDIQVIGKYVNTHTKILCKCKKCNTEWYAYPANLLNKSAGCLGCNISVGEKLMLDTLTKLNISFIPQYSIRDGIHKRPLRFDAFNEEYKIAFEYNGEQHYRPVDFAGKGIEWANKQFEITKERDNSKRNYCMNNGIDMVIIPYYDKDNMEMIINKSMNEVKNKLVS